ncbi:hypothetical protein HDV05_002329, partial [Chytridiales sp. JEL 0842]
PGGTRPGRNGTTNGGNSTNPDGTPSSSGDNGDDSGFSTDGPSSDPEVAAKRLRRFTLLVIHASTLYTAWALLPPLGIFIARFMKHMLGHWWFRLHVMILGFLLPLLVFVGVLCVELALPEGSKRFFTSNHGILGTVLTFVFLPLQLTLGVVADRLWSPTRTSIPWWDRLHWWVGRLSVLLGGVTIYLGLQVWEVQQVWYGVLFTAMAGAWGAVIMGEFVMGGEGGHGEAQKNEV